MNLVIWILTIYCLLGVFTSAWILVPMIANGESRHIYWSRLFLGIVTWPRFWIIPAIQMWREKE